MLPRWYTRWIERLRSQQPAVKSQVALIGAVTVTTIIAVVWVTTLPARFSALGGASSAVRDGVSETLEEAPGQDALLYDAFTPEPEPAEEPTQTEKELLRARIDALLGDMPKDETQPSSTVGEPVLIEAR